MRNAWRWLLILMLWAAFAAPSLATLLAPPGAQLRLQSEAGAAQAQYQKGLEALTQQQFDEAAARFNASRALDPAWPAPLLGLAEVALRRGDLSQVEHWLREAVALAPDDASTHTAVGRFALARGRLQEAEAALTRAVHLAPEAIEPRLELGGLYVNGLGRPADAEAAFAAVTQRAPDHGGAFHGLGMAQLAQGKTDAAVQAFQAAARLAPENPLPWHAQGRLHTRAGAIDEALAAYAQALQVQPDFVPSLVDRGYVYLGRGAWSEARADFEAAVHAAPANAKAHMGVAMAAQQIGDADRARQAYLAAIKIDPGLAMAYNNLAWLTLTQQGPTDRALRWAEAAVRQAPNVADFHDTLGWLLHLRGDHQRAAAQLEQALALQSQPHIHYHLGRVYLEMGRRGEAQLHLQRALAGGAEFEGAREASELLGSFRR